MFIIGKFYMKIESYYWVERYYVELKYLCSLEDDEVVDVDGGYIAIFE